MADSNYKGGILPYLSVFNSSASSYDAAATKTTIWIRFVNHIQIEKLSHRYCIRDENLELYGIWDSLFQLVVRLELSIL